MLDMEIEKFPPPIVLLHFHAFLYVQPWPETASGNDNHMLIKTIMPELIYFATDLHHLLLGPLSIVSKYHCFFLLGFPSLKVDIPHPSTMAYM